MLTNNVKLGKIQISRDSIRPNSLYQIFSVTIEPFVPP